MNFNFDNQRWFVGLMAMGVVLLILGSICWGSAGKADETAKNNCSRSAQGIVVISLVIMAMAGFYMYKQFGADAGKFNLYYY